MFPLRLWNVCLLGVSLIACVPTGETPADGGLPGWDAAWSDGQADTGTLDASEVDASDAGGFDAAVVCAGDYPVVPGPLTPPAAPCGTMGDPAASGGMLIDLGHVVAIKKMQRENERALSVDESGRWILWDAANRRVVAHGETVPVGESGRRLDPVMTATTLAVPTSSCALEVRATADAHLLTTILTPLSEVSSFGFSSDGSYVWLADETTLRAWTMAGTELISRSGNYSGAKVFGAPGELRVARGPAGDSLIETVSTTAGDSVVTSAFSGDFHSWFRDGQHFFTSVGTTVRVYSVDATQVSIIALSEIGDLAGVGTMFWGGARRDLYTIGDTSAAIKSLGAGPAYVSGNFVGVLRRDESSYFLDQYDLNAVGAPQATIALTFDSPNILARESVIAGDSTGGWTLGNFAGVVFDSADLERPLSCGRVYDTAGSDVGLVAIATAGAGVLLFDVGAPSSYVTTAPFVRNHVEMSRDGTVLAVGENEDTADRSVRVLALPSMTEMMVWPDVSGSGSPLVNFTMSVNGQYLGLGWGSSGSFAREVVDINASTVEFSDASSIPTPLSVSPDGTLVAVATGFLPSDGLSPEPVTNIYSNGSLSAVVPGVSVAWFANDSLVVERLGGGMEVYDASGAPMSLGTLSTYDQKRVEMGNTTGSVAGESVVYVGYPAAYEVTVELY